MFIREKNVVLCVCEWILLVCKWFWRWKVFDFVIGLGFFLLWLFVVL